MYFVMHWPIYAPQKKTYRSSGSDLKKSNFSKKLACDIFETRSIERDLLID